MFIKLLMLFTIIPVFELFLLVKVGNNIGTLNTIGLVILTGIVGASFAKSQGAQIIFEIRNSFQKGQIPGRELLEGAIILAGGIMLLTPGFITDLVGFSLLLPFTRQFYSALILSIFKKKFQEGQIKYTTYSEYNTPLNREEDNDQI